MCAHRHMLKYSLTTFLTSLFFLQGQRIKVLTNSPIMSSFWLFCYLCKHGFFCLDFFFFFPFSPSFIFAWISSPKPFSCFSFGKIQFPLDINLISLSCFFLCVPIALRFLYLCCKYVLFFLFPSSSSFFFFLCTRGFLSQVTYNFTGQRPFCVKDLHV